VPLLIATRLTAARRFDEAQRWFHRVFDPTDPEKRFWKVPLATAGDVESWLRAPFEPAQHRAGARSGEYQRAVVMKYLDNLLAWGDELIAHKATGAGRAALPPGGRRARPAAQAAAAERRRLGTELQPARRVVDQRAGVDREPPPRETSARPARPATASRPSSRSAAT
jgi:hypothetical protein